MIAVIVNTITVLIGGCLGLFLRNKIKENIVKSVICALATVTIVIGVQSAIKSSDTLCTIISIAFGTIIGELIKLDDFFASAGDLIKAKVLRGKNAGGRFTEGFVSACILFCVGSMTIMGSFEAGINKNYDIIFAKSTLDFFSSTMFGAAMGVGVPFAAVFVLVFQGALTLLAGTLSGVLSQTVVIEMSAVGGCILIAMGINMFELSDRRIKVANMLPGVFMPLIYLPIAKLLGA